MTETPMVKVYTKVDIHRQKNDFAFWQAQPYQARLAALEEIRREFHRWRYGAEPGFQRVLSLGLSASDFATADQVIQLGHAPRRIDVLTSLPGVDFAECFVTRVEVEVDGIQANFIDLEHLRINKRASGRLQDLADLENLEDDSK